MPTLFSPINVSVLYRLLHQFYTFKCQYLSVYFIYIYQICQCLIHNCTYCIDTYRIMWWPYRAIPSRNWCITVDVYFSWDVCCFSCAIWSAGVSSKTKRILILYQINKHCKINCKCRLCICLNCIGDLQAHADRNRLSIHRWTWWDIFWMSHVMYLNGHGCVLTFV